jgi:hypothetical protein
MERTPPSETVIVFGLAFVGRTIFPNRIFKTDVMVSGASSVIDAVAVALAEVCCAHARPGRAAIDTRMSANFANLVQLLMRYSTEHSISVPGGGAAQGMPCARAPVFAHRRFTKPVG